MTNYEPFSTVLRSLPRPARLRLFAAMESSAYTWRSYRLPATVTNAQLKQFAQYNLYRGFFDGSCLIIVAVSAAQRLDGSGWNLKLGCIRHPANVTLPIWATNMDSAVGMVFTGAVRSDERDAQ